MFLKRPEPKQVQTKAAQNKSDMKPVYGKASYIVEDESYTPRLPLNLVSSPPEQALQGTNLVEEHYLWTIQNPVVLEDPTLALQLHLTTLPNQKKRFIDIQSMSTYLLNYGGTDFPVGVQLCCQQLSGFIQDKGQTTNTIATCMPLAVSTVLNAGGIIGYNVVYKNDSNPIWDITNINTLSFKIKLFGDDAYRPLPSAQPIQVSAKISRVIF